MVDASWLRRGGAAVPGPVGDAARLLVAGDTHGDVNWIGSLAKMARRFGCQGVVQLGDFGMWPDQQVKRDAKRAVPNERWMDAVANTVARHDVWLAYVDGNHDFHPGYRERYPVLASGVRPIRDGAVSWLDRGAVVEWCGVRFGALGGAISIDRAVRRPGWEHWATEAIASDECLALVDRAGGRGIDVLLAHDCPSGVSIPDIRPLDDITLEIDCKHNRDMVRDVVGELRPTLVLHGHYHRRYSSGLWLGEHQARVEGLASDLEAHVFGASWCVLEVPSLRIVDDVAELPE